MALAFNMTSSAGILWVSSKIVSPDQLSVSSFDDWYENEHALEVLCLPGVPSAIRYTALDPANPCPHLITYEFPSLAYATDPDFQAVTNRALPQELLDKYYANCAFDIRFYAELPTPSAPHPSPSDPAADFKLACITLSPVEGKEAEFLLWFAKDLAEGLGSVEGFVRLRRFEFANGTLLERCVMSAPDRPGYLVLAKFESGDGGVEEIMEEVESWVAKGGLASAEVQWYGVKKVWVEGEVKKSVEAP